MLKWLHSSLTSSLTFRDLWTLIANLVSTSGNNKAIYIAYLTKWYFEKTNIPLKNALSRSSHYFFHSSRESWTPGLEGVVTRSSSTSPIRLVSETGGGRQAPPALPERSPSKQTNQTASWSISTKQKGKHRKVASTSGKVSFVGKKSWMQDFIYFLILEKTYLKTLLSNKKRALKPFPFNYETDSVCQIWLHMYAET